MSRFYDRVVSDPHPFSDVHASPSMQGYAKPGGARCAASNILQHTVLKSRDKPVFAHIVKRLRTSRARCRALLFWFLCYKHIVVKRFSVRSGAFAGFGVVSGCSVFPGNVEGPPPKPSSNPV